jgi:hypothetical protein
MRASIRAAAGSVAFALALAAALVSCSYSPSVPDTAAISGGRAKFNGSISEFTGPYSSEFAEAYRSTTDDFVHQVLAKESITDEDYAIASGRFVKCMANKGFKAEIIGPAGEMSIPGLPTYEDGERANAASAECGSEIAPPSYTAKDYARDIEDWDFPFSTSSTGFDACVRDPLGLGAR